MYSLIVLIFILVGLIALQLFLSKSKKRWPGLVIPALFFIYSLAPLLSMEGYVVSEMTTTYIDDEGNEVTESYENEPVYDNTPMGELLMMGVASLFIFNIPTAICIAIYYTVREKGKQSDQVDRSKIQDL
ncbi:hypothetical protein [Marinilactibacillus kalidii]|uniref:hypothetical protein n=1 Tax=Marinilactibacillus kalidii TaxID=2820274 RepID=UPI001ABEA196|nr:hypothetical protein [Marinilactibacillus kalidii]